MIRVAFTGHRPNKLGGYGETPTKRKVREVLAQTLIDIKPDEAICGMALGFDQWAADVCIELGIPFIAAIPFRGQESIWPEQSRRYYTTLCSKAEATWIVGDKNLTTIANLMNKRNMVMVDECDLLIALWDGTKGGTGNCVKYAREVGRPMINIYDKIGVV